MRGSRSVRADIVGGCTRFALATVALLAACAASEPAPPSDAPPLLPSLQVYTAADTVHFVLQVTNTTQAPIELNFRDGQTFDFIVSSNGAEVWRWSEGQMFSQALQIDRLGAGESRRYEASWRPPAGTGGEYVATGVLTASNHRVEQATRIVLP